MDRHRQELSGWLGFAGVRHSRAIGIEAVPASCTIAAGVRMKRKTEAGLYWRGQPVRSRAEGNRERWCLLFRLTPHRDAVGLWSAAILLLCLLVSPAGCERGPQPIEGLVRVSGRVTLDRRPFAGVMVVFDHPDHASSYGRTDDQGFYEMAYTQSQDGAFSGRNRVYFATADTDRRSPERVPGDYRRQSSSLYVEVTAGGSPYNFDLVSGEDQESELETGFKPL